MYSNNILKKTISLKEKFIDKENQLIKELKKIDSYFYLILIFYQFNI